MKIEYLLDNPHGLLNGGIDEDCVQAEEHRTESESQEYRTPKLCLTQHETPLLLYHKIESPVGHQEKDNIEGDQNL